MRHIPRIVLVIMSIVCAVNPVDGLAVMSIDLGSDCYKMALVKPGVPMEIILNKESRRKTAVVVSLRDDERVFGDDALAIGVRYPKTTYVYLQDLLAKGIDNPVVQLYKKRFPYHDIRQDPERDTILFQHSEDLQYTPEELLAMILNRAQEMAAAFAEQPIKDVVITVPAYFNQAERRSVKHAAELVGLNVLQLMNDNAAVALNYGVFRRTTFNVTPTNIMFYDMGASSTTATIVSYQIVKTKEKGISETNPQLTVKGIGFDRTLGGFEVELRLREHFAKVFTEQGKAKSNVYESPRAMAKLLKEAKRIKKVLSANTEHMAQIEGLIDDVDFRVKITREEMETMCADLFARVKNPVRMAIESADMTLGEIDQVILMGGGTRIPKVQELLLEAVKKSELGKNINADEAAALGASYQAAYLSKGFKVKKFVVKDANLYPIEVEFERSAINDEGVEFQKTVKRTLFGRNNPYPQKKVMTFNKHTDDFAFSVNYGDLSFVNEDYLKIFGKRNLTRISLTGVADALNNNHDAESKGVKAHFRMDESGLLYLDKVESVFERLPPENETESEPEKEQSTFQKLGSTISSFFSGSKKEDTEAPVEEEEEEDEKPKPQEEEEKEEAADEKVAKEDEKKSEDEKESENEPKEEEKSDDEKDETKENETKEDETKEDEKKDQEKEDDKTEEKEPDTKSEKEEKPEEKEAKKKPPKPVTLKEEIKMEVSLLDLPNPSKESRKLSVGKLEELKKKDEEKAEKEKAMNSLESFIFETQDKLSQSEYEKASTEEERTELSGKLSEASDWLYEDGYDADAKVFKEKYKELKKLFKELFFRVKEHQERPQLIKRLKESLNASTHFIKVAKNLTSSGLDDTFTEVEMETLEKLINETEEWKTTKVAEQKNTPKSEKPTLLTEDIKEKISALDREVMYLLNKAKREKPKKDKERAKKEKERLKAENETKTEEEIKIETGAEKSEDEDAQVVDEGEEGVWPIDAPDPRDEQNVDGDKETIETQEELPETNETVENEKEEEEILQIDSPNETGSEKDSPKEHKKHDPNEL